MSHYFTEERNGHSTIEWEAINRAEGEQVARDLRAAAPADARLSVHVLSDAPDGTERVRVRASARLPLFELQTLVLSMPLPGQDYELLLG